MGAYVSAEARAAKRSAQIDELLEKDARRRKLECKVLLLGPGESGKSTVVKQMKLIYQFYEFTRDELMIYRSVVNKNVVESAQNVANAIIKFSLQPEIGVNRDYMIQIKDFKYDPDLSFTLPPSLAEAIESFWRDPIIQTLMERSNEFYLMDSADYFFTNVKRICNRNYVPTQHDVLRAQAKTIGIIETRFKMGPLSINMLDIGDQRSERRKYIHLFEDVTSILFCVAISDYDRVDINQNRLQEALVLFDSIVNARWFSITSIILFLNKTDVFREKLPRSPLARYFPEFTGGDDLQKAAKFILWKFVMMNRARLTIYPQYVSMLIQSYTEAHNVKSLTQTTDLDRFRLIFVAVTETILHNCLRDVGLI